MVKKVLVTGKTGQLGRELYDLSQIKLSSQEYSIKFIGREDVDLANLSKTRCFIKEFGPDYIIHTAAKVGGIHFNIKNSYTMLYDNLVIDMNVITAALEIQVKNLIYFSSSCMYPVGGEQPYTTESLYKGSFEPTNENYAIAKSTISKLLLGIDESEDLNYKSFILSNLYGKYDNFTEGQSHILASAYKKIYSAVQSNTSEVVIWGSGNPRREFTRSNDVAGFTLKALEKIQELPPMLNLGSGVDYSVFEIYKIIKELLNYKGDFVFDHSKPDGIFSKLMNSDCARNSFGWNPQSDLKNGIAMLLKDMTV